MLMLGCDAGTLNAMNMQHVNGISCGSHESQRSSNHEVNGLYARNIKFHSLTYDSSFLLGGADNISTQHGRNSGGINDQGRAKFHSSLPEVAASQAHRTVCARPSGNSPHGLATFYSCVRQSRNDLHHFGQMQIERPV